MRKESQLNGKESQQLLTFIDNNGQHNITNAFWLCCLHSINGLAAVNILIFKELVSIIVSQLYKSHANAL